MSMNKAEQRTFYLLFAILAAALWFTAHADAATWPGPQPIIPPGAKTPEAEFIKKATSLIGTSQGMEWFYIHANEINVADAKNALTAGVDAIFTERVADAVACLKLAQKYHAKRQALTAKLAKLLEKIKKRSVKLL